MSRTLHDLHHNQQIRRTPNTPPTNHKSFQSPKRQRKDEDGPPPPKISREMRNGTFTTPPLSRNPSFSLDLRYGPNGSPIHDPSKSFWNPRDGMIISPMVPSSVSTHSIHSSPQSRSGSVTNSPRFARVNGEAFKAVGASSELLRARLASSASIPILMGDENDGLGFGLGLEDEFLAIVEESHQIVIDDENEHLVDFSNVATPVRAHFNSLLPPSESNTSNLSGMTQSCSIDSVSTTYYKRQSDCSTNTFGVRGKQQHKLKLPAASDLFSHPEEVTRKNSLAEPASPFDDSASIFSTFTVSAYYSDGSPRQERTRNSPSMNLLASPPLLALMEHPDDDASQSDLFQPHESSDAMEQSSIEIGGLVAPLEDPFKSPEIPHLRQKTSRQFDYSAGVSPTTPTAKQFSSARPTTANDSDRRRESRRQKMGNDSAERVEVRRPRTAGDSERRGEFKRPATATTERRLTAIKPTITKRPKTADSQLKLRTVNLDRGKRREDGGLTIEPPSAIRHDLSPTLENSNRQEFITPTRVLHHQSSQATLHTDSSGSNSLLKNGISSMPHSAPPRINYDPSPSPLQRPRTPGGYQMVSMGLDFDEGQVPLTPECFNLRLRVDEEGFREVNPILKFARWDRSLNMLEFKSDRSAYPFHSSSMQANPVLRKLIAGTGLEPGYSPHKEKDFLSREANLSCRENGVWVVEGTEVINKEKYTWSFAYEVDDRFTLMGKLMPNEKSFRPLVLCCAPQILAPSNAKSARLLQSFKKSVLSKLDAVRLDSPTSRKFNFSSSKEVVVPSYPSLPDTPTSRITPEEYLATTRSRTPSSAHTKSRNSYTSSNSSSSTGKKSFENPPPLRVLMQQHTPPTSPTSAIGQGRPSGAWKRPATADAQGRRRSISANTFLGKRGRSGSDAQAPPMPHGGAMRSPMAHSALAEAPSYARERRLKKPSSRGNF